MAGKAVKFENCREKTVKFKIVAGNVVKFEGIIVGNKNIKDVAFLFQ